MGDGDPGLRHFNVLAERVMIPRESHRGLVNGTPRDAF